jgi:hypothetical protein
MHRGRGKIERVVRTLSFPGSGRAVQLIMTVCRYAVCPVPNCMGLVIPAYEPDSRKMFLELSRRWYLECPACHGNFVIADSELKTDEISFTRIRQTYPDKP